MHGRSQGGGARIADHPPLWKIQFFIAIWGPFSPFGDLSATFLFFMWGLFYHAACGGLSAILSPCIWGLLATCSPCWGLFCYFFFIVGGPFYVLVVVFFGLAHPLTNICTGVSALAALIRRKT